MPLPALQGRSSLVVLMIAVRGGDGSELPFPSSPLECGHHGPQGRALDEHGGEKPPNPTTARSLWGFRAFPSPPLDPKVKVAPIGWEEGGGLVWW